MKKRNLILLAIVALCSVRGAETTNSFGIYLTSEPVDKRIIAYGRGDWSRIRLSEFPLISAADIVSYDLRSHALRLRSEALARMPRPSVEGTPFVVVASGQRVYLGVFTSSDSSREFAVPNIMVDRRVLVTNQISDILVIERGSLGTAPDPRGDQRIKTVLAALHKLKGHE